MSDPRLTPANGRVAATYLQGTVEADQFTEGTAASVAQNVVNLYDAPRGKRERQLLLGTGVVVYEARDGWAFVQSKRDGYVGYVAEGALADPVAPTHRVATPATHAFTTEDFKSPDLMHLPFAAEVVVLDERRKMFETPQGFIPKKHLRPLEQPFQDPATVAQLFFGVPYLWGGNSTLGIDCSGLVQAAYLACGYACDGDSDLQMERLGHALAPDAPLTRGDLIFWDGHVAMMVDGETMIHANAHHMAVAYEGLEQAALRIKAQGDGEVLARRRVIQAAI
ncbi:NlpC/P60 family protein [Thalassorhabdomicrobium marinisediminis]|uniref:NLP/P60 hydrolase n=1 Tax=Thalassorhabdomicrobium marinisediminis TaxID=2170577 RepID=A0A2T7FVV1_9RHOB|nr:NlpC/P60 family protein [Thalassorhabdomicrobium marinisediminis]PVA06284.1 NLP/P60 hydrolase [Thalassorhabdomicrobium marinisediminis]